MSASAGRVLVAASNGCVVRTAQWEYVVTVNSLQTYTLSTPRCTDTVYMLAERGFIKLSQDGSVAITTLGQNYITANRS